MGNANYTATEGVKSLGATETGFWLAETTAGTVSGAGASEDISLTGTDLDATGTLTKSAVETNAELMQWSGFSAANYLSRAYGSELDIGTGDFTISGWFKVSSLAADQILFSRTDTPTTDELLITVESTGEVTFHDLTTDQSTGAGTIVVDTWYFLSITRVGTAALIYLSGVVAKSWTSSTTLSFATGLRFGGMSDGTAGSELTAGSIALWRIDNAVGATAAQIKTVYDAEKWLFKDYAIKTIVGSNYDIDLSLTSAIRSESVQAASVVSLGGNQETTFNRRDVSFSLTVNRLSASTLPEYMSFMHSIEQGQTFQLDRYGSAASPDDPINVKAKPGYTEARAGFDDYYTTTLMVREV